MPAGTFPAWRVEMDFGSGKHDAWYGQDAPYPLVKYLNRGSGAAFVLRSLGTGLPASAAPANARQPRRKQPSRGCRGTRRSIVDQHSAAALLVPDPASADDRVPDRARLVDSAALRRGLGHLLGRRADLRGIAGRASAAELRVGAAGRRTRRRALAAAADGAGRRAERRRLRGRRALDHPALLPETCARLAARLAVRRGARRRRGDHLRAAGGRQSSDHARLEQREPRGVGPAGRRGRSDQRRLRPYTGAPRGICPSSAASSGCSPSPSRSRWPKW